MDAPTNLAPPLKAILDAELAAGNTIAEAADWPPKCSLLVILRRPFRQRYTETEDVEYADINDTHYWKAEYRYKGGQQCLACRFG